MPYEKTFANIVETTYNTPLVRLNRVIPPGGGNRPAEARVLQSAAPA